MSTNPLKLSLAVMALLVPTLAQSTGEACTGMYCLPLRTLPQQSATVPANLPAFRIYGEPRLPFVAPDGGIPDGGFVDGSAPLAELVYTLSRRSAGHTPVPLGMVNVMGPWRDVPINAPLVVGETYELIVRAPCVDSTQTIETLFTAGPAAAAPTSLGQLVMDPPRARTVPIPTINGGCSIDAPAYGADVHVELSSDAQPWSDVLVYTTLVDGMPWAPEFSLNGSFGMRFPAPGGAYLGRGRDEVHTLCGGRTQVLAAGTHTVQMTAQRPGDPTILRTNEVMVELRCPANTNTDGGYSPDAITETPRPMHGGGGCSVARRPGQRAPGGFALALFAVALVAQRALRRQS